MNKKLQRLTYTAVIAGLYVALTWLSKLCGLTSLLVEVRLSEALCILPYFTPSAVSGLFVGCLISNLSTGAIPLDIIVGSLATLIGAYLTSKIKNKWLCPIPAVLSNAIFIPFVLMKYTEIYSVKMYFVYAFGVFVSEAVSAYILGIILLKALEKRKIFKK